jgi:uncharacterized protein
MIKINQEILEAVREFEEDGRLTQEKACLQHGKTSVYEHSLLVAEVSLQLARKLHMKVNTEGLIRGALLHDYFLYDWHDPANGHPLHGFSHPQTAYENAAMDFDLTDLEKDIITHHMFPLTLHPPGSREAWLVCVADKLCAFQETVNRF